MREKKNNISGVIAIVSLLIAGSLMDRTVVAKEGDEFLELEYFSDIPIIHTVSRIPQTLAETPASVTVIDRRMIEASGARDIPDLFRMVPGFQVGHYSGKRVTVTYHGMSDEYARRMQVLVDGRSVYLPVTGGVDWFDLPLSLDDIERIEITRGPNGVSYGANAFLATINIITYQPVDVVGTTLSVNGGGNGYRNGFVRYAENLRDFSYRVSFEYQEDDGYDDVTFPDGDVFKLKDDKLIRKGTFRGEYRAGINDYLSFRLGVNSGIQGDGVESDPTMPLHDNDMLRNYEQFNWKRNIGSNEDIEIKLHHERSVLDGDYSTEKMSVILADVLPKVNSQLGTSWSMDEFLLYLGFPDSRVAIDQGYKINRYDVEFLHRKKMSEIFRYAWAGEVRVDEAISEGLFGHDNKVTDKLFRLSGNGEWHLNHDLIFNAGAMAEKNDITGIHYSPRVALNYTWTANHSIRASYSKAYRTPAFLEAYSDYAAYFESDGSIIDQLMKSGDDLSPEKITSIELGFSGSSRTGALSYDIRLFKEYLRDLIVAYVNHNSDEPLNQFLVLPVGSGYVTHYCVLLKGGCTVLNFNNDGYADMNGIETQVTYKPDERLMLVVGLSVVDASGEYLSDSNYINGDPDIYQTIDMASPSFTSSFLLDYKFGSGWSGSVGYNNVSDMKFFGGDSTGGYSVVDLRLAKQFGNGAGKGIIELVVENAMDSDYFDFGETVVQERNIYLGTQIRF